MKLLAIMRPRDGSDIRAELSRLAVSELRTLWQLYRDGIVREIYSPGGPGAVLALEAASVTDAQRALAGLPLIKANLITLEIIELHPFAAIEMLFSKAPDGG